MTQTTRPGAARTLLLVLLLAVVWFGPLGYRALIKSDEGRYAEIAREMHVSGDWVTPRMNDLKYFYKPPLQYWATAAAYGTLGENEFAARLWPALTGFLTVLFAGFAAGRVFGPAYTLPVAAVLASALWWNGLSHINNLDGAVASFMAMALFALLLAQRDGIDRRVERNWMLACWAAMALAVLSKGLIGVVLPGAVLVAYTLLARDWALWQRLHIVSGLLVFLALAAPWFVLVSRANPEFLQYFFVHEHFERFLTTVHRRTAPWWYFVPLVLASVLPWLAGLPGAVIAALRRGAQRNGFRPALLALVWVVLIFLFFSASSSKLRSYILPVVPALALLIGLWLPGARRPAVLAIAALAAALGIGGVAMAPFGARLADEAWLVEAYRVFWLWIGAGAALLLAGSIALAALELRGRRPAGIVALAAAGCAGTLIAMSGHEAVGRLSSARELVRAVGAQFAPEQPFYSVRFYDHTLPFYLKRTFTLVDYADEMAFGIGQEPHKVVPTLDEFVKRWDTDRAPSAVMGNDTFELLAKRGVPMRVIWKDPRRVLVVKEIR
jgi:4-amino-4-deoxy-L-arabinose transferase-like glycosyltransferase